MSYDVVLDVVMNNIESNFEMCIGVGVIDGVYFLWGEGD